jgi:hypothetical protein
MHVGGKANGKLAAGSNLCAKERIRLRSLEHTLINLPECSKGCVFFRGDEKQKQRSPCNTATWGKRPRCSSVVGLASERLSPPWNSSSLCQATIRHMHATVHHCGLWRELQWPADVTDVDPARYVRLCSLPGTPHPTSRQHIFDSGGVQ